MSTAFLAALAAVTVTIAVTYAIGRHNKAKQRGRRGGHHHHGEQSPFQSASSPAEEEDVLMELEAGDERVRVLGVHDDAGAVHRSPFVGLAVLRDRVRWRPRMRALALSRRDEFLVENLARVAVSDRDPHVLLLFALARPRVSGCWRHRCCCCCGGRSRELFHARLHFSDPADLERVRALLLRLLRAEREPLRGRWRQQHQQQPQKLGASTSASTSTSASATSTTTSSSAADHHRHCGTVDDDGRHSCAGDLHIPPAPAVVDGDDGLPLLEVLVLINPVSGLKRGPELCGRFLDLVCAVAGIGRAAGRPALCVGATGRVAAVHPAFTRTPVTLRVERTERERHAYDIARTLSAGRTVAVVCIGGDGLIHEVVNGLLATPGPRRGTDGDNNADGGGSGGDADGGGSGGDADADDEMVPGLAGSGCRCRIPLLPVPAGTGNGFAMSMGIPPHDVATAALYFLRGRLGVHDVLAVETLRQPSTTVPGERQSGARRSTADTSDDGNHSSLHSSHKKGHEHGHIPLTYCVSFVSYGIVSDTDRDSEMLRWMGSLRFSVMALWKVLRGGTVHAKVSYRLARRPAGRLASGSAPNEREHCGGVGGGDVGGSDAAVPHRWQCVAERSFFECCFVNVPFVSHDIKFGTFAGGDDGCVDISLLPASVSRLRILLIFLLAKDGRYVTQVNSARAGNGCQYFKAEEVHVTPVLPGNSGGSGGGRGAAAPAHMYDIDGEFFPSSRPLRVTVRAAQLRVLR